MSREIAKKFHNACRVVTEEIFSSLEVAPTGNYWFGRKWNLFVTKEKEHGRDEYFMLKLENYGNDGECFDFEYDTEDTSSNSKIELFAAIGNILDRNTFLLNEPINANIAPLVLPNSLVSIFQSHGFCVDKGAKIGELGVQYTFTRCIIGKVAFSVTVETGKTLNDFTEALDEHLQDFKNSYEDENIPKTDAEYWMTSAEELYVLTQKWRDIKNV